MNIDCTLNKFSIPGFTGVDPEFGIKKPIGESISSREANTNIMMPFTTMRPHIVNDNSTTTAMESNRVFDLVESGITLEISGAAYNGCRAHVINSSSGSAEILVNESETISLFSGEIIALEFIDGVWSKRAIKDTQRSLSAFDFIADDPIVASTDNVDVAIGGNIIMDGVTLQSGDRVLLKDQTDPVQNGYWIVQSGTWNRDPNYAAGNKTAFTNVFISPLRGSQAGKVFFLIQDKYVINTSVLNFVESAFATKNVPGKIAMYDKNGILPLGNLLADQIDGIGRDLRLVFGIQSSDPLVYVPLIMAEIRRRCNNDGEIDNTGIPDFTGIEIGDYIDGISLDGIAVAPGGNAPQVWNDTYKNNRILVSGFNTFKNSGDTETTKNHILFTFRNVICQGRMRSSNTNAGGYPATDMRTWLEGATGDGNGALANRLKTALGGNFLLTFRQLLSSKGNWVWANTTLFLHSENNVFGSEAWGEAGYGDGLKVHFPIYQKSSVFRVKRFNGSRAWWWLSAPYASGSTAFCIVYDLGYASTNFASIGIGGVAPAFCIA